MFLFRRSGAASSARLHALHTLYFDFTKTLRKHVRGVFSANGCLLINVRSLMPRVISKSLALTPADDIEFTMVP